MDLSSLGATFEANKTPILAAAGAGVVGLGLYAKKKKATTASSAGAGGASSGGQTAGMTGGGAYDSSASDLYGAIQPQLESLGGQLTDLRNLYASGSSSGTPPTPVPAPTPAPTPISTGPPAPSTSATPTPVYNPVPTIMAGLTGAGLSPTATPATAAQIANGYTGPTINGGGSSNGAYQVYATGPNTYGLMTGLPSTGSEGPIGSVISDGAGGWKKVTGYSFTGAPSHVASTKDGLTIGANYQPIPGTAPSGGPLAPTHYNDGGALESFYNDPAHWISSTNVSSDVHKWDPRTNSYVNL